MTTAARWQDSLRYVSPVLHDAMVRTGQEPAPVQRDELRLPAISPFWATASVISTGLGAYHGYRRNDSIGWGLWWGLMGGLFPIVTPAIAFAQGFGKRA